MIQHKGLLVQLRIDDLAKDALHTMQRENPLSGVVDGVVTNWRQVKSSYLVELMSHEFLCEIRVG